RSVIDPAVPRRGRVPSRDRRDDITPLHLRCPDAAAPRSDEGRRGLSAPFAADAVRFSGGDDVDGLYRSSEPRGDGGAVSARADVSVAARGDARRAAIAAQNPRTAERARARVSLFLLSSDS